MAINIRRNNRIVPPIICLLTFCLLWQLLDLNAAQVLKAKQASSAAKPAPSKQHPTDPTWPQGQTPGSDSGTTTTTTTANLTSDDVLLILKTGGTVLWRRLPIHLSTTFAPERIGANNTVIYADVDAQIGRHAVIDVLASFPTALREKSPAFETYREIRDWHAANHYLEQTGLPGDVSTTEGPSGGWRLDKYKFLPLMQRAGRDFAQAKWYIYTEDDTYLFLPNVLRYLSRYDHTRPHYLGGLGEMLGVTFAHGGSGFALSRGAWEQSFGKGGDLVSKYATFVTESSFGDYALGKVLNDYGVQLGDEVTNDRKEGGAWGFNGLPHWKNEFSAENWCKPVLSWHHVHSRDIAMYYELEKSWNFEKTLTYGDFYKHAIAPTLTKRKSWWDNMSRRHHLTPQSVVTAEIPKDVRDSSSWKESWKSDKLCEAACTEWKSCVQWYYYQYECKLDDRFWLGFGYPETSRYRKEKLESISGWLPDRINSWTCT
ncbi:hypothetical protein MCOR27_011390 [Pyricularia oryzae]|nr:hypothetical protein MCOR01_005316 [Pyricularia oryzae]KAI6254975.1 hypothetical protein MCOR19_008541 [Pyricularia oryzae]KAI6265474.1 hypothetical protein MCOR27_011390 [Pyricularia oryzae]KAI6268401.1 hypothetical protein MCOR26_009217 [Pyricularia oryzae]KAI6309293.1 hypothetical protein MCOR29_008995 [Pyricularia oryzae]